MESDILVVHKRRREGRFDLKHESSSTDVLRRAMARHLYVLAAA
jgi:hypothetical protein